FGGREAYAWARSNAEKSIHDFTPRRCLVPIIADEIVSDLRARLLNVAAVCLIEAASTITPAGPPIDALLVVEAEAAAPRAHGSSLGGNVGGGKGANSMEGAPPPRNVVSRSPPDGSPPIPPPMRTGAPPGLSTPPPEPKSFGLASMR